MVDLGEVLDPIRKQVIDIKDALAHARYRYDGLDLILDNVSDSKVRGASQEIFAVASEKMNAIDDMLDELYRQLSAVDRTLEVHYTSQKHRNL
jgi:lipopolysaccharide biosynthesis regulator YciM